jgi:hypothetical protein
LLKPKTYCYHLATAEHANQNNHNGKTTAVLFCNVSTSALKECQAFAYCWRSLLTMSIDDAWMVNLMIIYIEKTVAKALDINNIIKKIMGMFVSSMSPNISINSQLRPAVEF